MKYKNESIRLKNWDYTGVACYFVTLIINQRQKILSKITQDNSGNYKVILTDIGQIVESELLRSESMRSEVSIDEYVIMPDHIHFIVFFHGNKHKTLQNEFVSEPPNFYLQKKSLGAFISGFKSAVNTKVDDHIDKHRLDINKFNKNNPFFQRNYHERIIKDSVNFKLTKTYIQNNPEKWFLKSLENKKLSNPI